VARKKQKPTRRLIYLFLMFRGLHLVTHTHASSRSIACIPPNLYRSTTKPATTLAGHSNGKQQVFCEFACKIFFFAEGPRNAVTSKSTFHLHNIFLFRQATHQTRPFPLLNVCTHTRCSTHPPGHHDCGRRGKTRRLCIHLAHKLFHAGCSQDSATTTAARQLSQEDGY